MRKRIVHIMISCFYKEGYGYQENILPLKHKELGYETFIVTYKGKEHIFPEDVVSEDDGQYHEYINRHGIPVYVLKRNDNYLQRIPLAKLLLNKTCGLFEKLEELNPDIIFCHGIQDFDHLLVVKYKEKHPQVEVFADNHSDYYNTPLKTFRRKMFFKTFYRYVAKRLESCSEKIWGVTPWRVRYLREVYGLSSEKTGLLVMGGDENFIDWENRAFIRKEIRDQYGIRPDSFLIVTGGKIDKTKNIHLLLEAVYSMTHTNVSLIVFGNYDEEMEYYKQKYTGNNILNVGWIDSQKIYPYFLAADLAFFPGTHSVLWEQACASGLPCVFKDWDEGMSHVDVGGNCIFLKNISVESIVTVIQYLLDNPDEYQRMLAVASIKGRKKFSYIEIAKRAIQVN